MKKKAIDRKSDERSKISRSDEDRSFELREAEMIPVFDMNYQDPTYIPPEFIPEGYSYRWVRISVHGQEDRSRMVEMKRKGWMLVPASRHPDMVFEDFFGNGRGGYIEYKGSILCERLKKYCDQERAMYERLNYERVTSMPGTENYMGDHDMPATNLSYTATRMTQRIG